MIRNTTELNVALAASLLKCTREEFVALCLDVARDRTLALAPPATPRTIPEPNYPSQQALRLYGMTRERYRELWVEQGGGCAICGKPPEDYFDRKTGKLVLGTLMIDHEHVSLWKRKPPHERVLFVRCLACRQCNGRMLPLGLDSRKAANTLAMLRRYEARRPADPSPKPKRVSKRKQKAAAQSAAQLLAAVFD